MIMEVEVGEVYLSGKGTSFRVLHKARHGQDCSHPMVVYMNIEDTADSPAGTVWVVSESLFIKKFRILPGNPNINEVIK